MVSTEYGQWPERAKYIHLARGIHEVSKWVLYTVIPSLTGLSTEDIFRNVETSSFQLLGVKILKKKKKGNEQHH